MNNNLIEFANNDNMIGFTKTDDILTDMQKIIEQAQSAACKAVNVLLVKRNRLIGYRIAAEEIGEADRAQYGAGIIAGLSKELSGIYGKGFTKTNLYSCYAFYKNLRIYSHGHITEP